MTLAYAFELEGSPPLKLVEVAWILDPFIVCLVVDNAGILSRLPFSPHLSAFMKEALYLFQGETLKKSSFKKKSSRKRLTLFRGGKKLKIVREENEDNKVENVAPSIPNKADLKKLKDKAIEYLVQSHPIAGKKLNLLRSNCIEKCTPLEAKKLFKIGFIQKKDFERSLHRLITQATPLEAKGLFKEGLFSWKDYVECVHHSITQAPPRVAKGTIQKSPAGDKDAFERNSLISKQGEGEIGIIYTKKALEEILTRNAWAISLSEKRWVMRIKTMLTSYGFLEHPQFPDGVFFHVSSVTGPIRLTHGDRVEVTVVIQKDKKRSAWGYMATNMRPLQEIDNIDKE